MERIKLNRYSQRPLDLDMYNKEKAIAELTKAFDAMEEKYPNGTSFKLDWTANE